MAFDLDIKEPEAMLYVPAGRGQRENYPRAVRLVHRQTGIGNAQIEHRVEIRDVDTYDLVADFPVRWASRWLIDRGYTYILGTNGLWSR